MAQVIDTRSVNPVGGSRRRATGRRGSKPAPGAMFNLKYRDMRKMSLEQAISNAIDKYNILQTEDAYLRDEGNYIMIGWHVFMDKYINYYHVCCVAKFIRKYTDKPIYCGFGKMKV